MPESIAWLLNIRGGDVPHKPMPLSFAILRQDARSHILRPAQNWLLASSDLGNWGTVRRQRGAGPASDELAAEAAGCR